MGNLKQIRILNRKSLIVAFFVKPYLVLVILLCILHCSFTCDLQKTIGAFQFVRFIDTKITQSGYGMKKTLESVG